MYYYVHLVSVVGKYLEYTIKFAFTLQLLTKLRQYSRHREVIKSESFIF